ncbi:MAG: hypothetical protein NTW94_09690 [Legionellales bacterium]|nr:hypothetical protein [Legionellales bacterium]
MSHVLRDLKKRLGDWPHDVIPHAFLLIWVVLFYNGLMNYEGSKGYYCVFSLSFLFLLISSCKKPPNYSYLFFSVFLWLGFWLKLTVHTIFRYAYQESIGLFQPQADSLDAVLLISTVGCLGILTARCLAPWVGLKSTLMINTSNRDKTPYLYRKYRQYLWPILIASSLGLSLYNGILGVFQMGLIPKHYLIWPLNAAISWLLSIGLALGISTFLWWDIKEKKDITASMSYPLAEGFFSSISIFSRSLYICHVVPLLVALGINRQKTPRLISKRGVWGIGGFAILLFLLSMQSVTLLRDYYYLGRAPDYLYEPPSTKMSFILSGVNLSGVANATVSTVSRLILDRWVGTEGVMAVWAYPKKSSDLLNVALFEKAVIGQASVFQTITQSSYGEMDKKKFVFATLPGPIAFLYYSGSLSIVFFGMFALTFLAMLCECVVAWLTHNFLLCALFGMDIAYLCAQLGVTPRLVVIHVFLILGYCLFVFLVSWKRKGLLEISKKIDTLFHSEKEGQNLRE